MLLRSNNTINKYAFEKTEFRKKFPKLVHLHLIILDTSKLLVCGRTGSSPMI